ncbi:glucose-6-phosphate 1-dehydrogenase [Kytococcus aerolatus]|uniref:Glucose-6-phosphate 1-dehydrogenase n=1 Tax=Kytococcus aerolatus TaxID=592308 RepID=A0A212U5W5_9MICO|nr:glucose-6-phosphate dehydrogenase [Kytococcus aerolatus]SNC73586.1 glucose-6-phosphate 1-dehydrogenase [Kytococcus aerolatus]
MSRLPRVPHTHSDGSLEDMQPAEPVTLVIFGASGDLTQRLLLPGVATLLEVEPFRQVDLIGVDREDMGQEWAELVRSRFEAEEVPAETTERVVAAARFEQVDLLEGTQLADFVAGLPESAVLYFALPPAVTQAAIERLRGVELPKGTRLALEKPFGDGVESAEELNRLLLSLVPENQIYRVDHFLGAAMLLNFIGMRFSNRILEKVWNAEDIEKVEITYDEDLALEGRAGYYDKAGALKDMLQSHLLQVLAIVAMEPPARVDADELRDLKAHVLNSTYLWGDDPAASSRRARYTAGTLGEREIPDYTAEEGVDPARNTETLAQLTLEVRTDRWSGVPWVLRSGKGLGEKAKEVRIFFRDVRHLPVGLEGEQGPDVLVVALKPGPVELHLTMNATDPTRIETKVLETTVGDPAMLPYGEVLGGILDGNPLLTVRGDTAVQSWRIIEQVMEVWSAGEVPMEEYPAGSAGPEGWGVDAVALTGGR